MADFKILSLELHSAIKPETLRKGLISGRFHWHRKQAIRQQLQERRRSANMALT